METVLISGGSGMLGRRLTELLLQKGYSVAHLSRKKRQQTQIKQYTWDPATGVIENGAIENANYVIHLAGEGIVDKKWTQERKNLIESSRVKTSQLLAAKIAELKVKPKAFISASAIGYYGFAEESKVFKEEDKAAEDFVGLTCLKWEEACQELIPILRVVWIRIGIVLAKEGGALPKLSLPVKLGIGSALGTGEQYVPWIHIDDVCRVFIHAIENTHMQGAYNAVAPDSCKQAVLIKEIGKALNRPIFMPHVPAILLKILLGSRADLVLRGNRIANDKLMRSGFTFNYPNLSMALRQLFQKGV